MIREPISLLSPEQIKANVNTIVFDFETASPKRDAALFSLGGFAFNRFSVEETVDAQFVPELNFYQVFEMSDQFFKGFRFDQSTAEWWRKKNADQISHIVKSSKINLAGGLLHFSEFAKDLGIEVFFSRHTHADYSWLENACNVLNMKNPVAYNRVFDISTAILQATGEIKGYIETGRTWAHHNALDDSQRDAMQLAMVTQPGYSWKELQGN